MLLVIDNYDSFTFNLVQYLGEENVDMQVHRNDEITLEKVEALQPERILISPGPCTCLLYTSPSPRDQRGSRMPSSA